MRGLLVFLVACGTSPSNADAGTDAVAETSTDAPVGSCPGFPPPQQQAGGTTWVVSPSGADTNAGTQASPFLTLGKAASVVNPGDTVIAEDGTYTGSGNFIVTIDRGGAANNYVWFHARNRWKARVDGMGTAHEAFSFQNGVGFVRIEGFDITGVASDQGAGGVALYGGGHDSVVLGNHFHDIGRMCTSTANGEVGVFVQQPNVIVEANLFDHIGRFSAGENACAPTNMYWQNHDHGVYVDGNADSTAPGSKATIIRNNVFDTFAHGWAIQLYPGTLDGIRVLNNTFAGPNPNRDGQIVVDVVISNSFIQNNIFAEPQTSALSLGTVTATNVMVSDNLTTAAAMMNATTPAGMTLSNDTTNGTVPFVSATDFHLQSAVPGATLSDVTLDFDGCVRPQSGAQDMGAFER